MEQKFSGYLNTRDGFLFREIIECLEEGIWKVSAAGQTEFVNQRVADMLGYPRSELLQKTLFDFLADEEKQNAREVVSRPDAAFCLRRRFVRRDGEIRWFRVTSNPSYGPDGQFSGRIGIIVDVSKEKAIEEERDKFFSESLDLLGIAGTDAYFKRLNPAFEKTLGWSTEELLAKPYLEFVHPDDQELTVPVAEKLTQGMEITSFENRYRCKDGTYRWLSWKCSPPKNGATYFAARDVTEQKKLQLALKASVEMQETLKELGELALRSSDLQVVHDLAVTLCADTLQIEFCSLSELLPGGESVQMIAGVGWDKSMITRPGFHGAKFSLSPHAGFVLADHGPVIVEDYATENRLAPSSPLRDAGIVSGATVLVAGSEGPFGVLSVHSRVPHHFTEEEINFLIGVSHILSTAIERRKLEGQLKTSDRMASVGVLAAGVAHEINNPLSYVVMNLDLLHRSLSSEESGTVDKTTLLELAQHAQDGAERVRQVVKDLKTFSGNSDDRLGPVDLRNVIEFGLRMASNHLKYRAQVTTDFAEAPLAQANENRLGQVILNILINAAQAIPEGHAEQNEVRVRLSTDLAGRAVIEIKDTGVGIPPEVMPRIFDPFFTTKPIGVGTGLGLAICRNIILKLNGDLSIESRAGFGTLVRIALPAADKDERSEVKAVPATSSFTGTKAARSKVLIVDDEALLIESLGKALAHGHDVQTTTSPKEALNLILKNLVPFDVIFCDLMMAELTGMAFFEELKRVKPGFEKRVIFMTGGAFTAEAREFLENVPNARIEKPFNLKDIRAILASCTTQKGFFN